MVGPAEAYYNRAISLPRAESKRLEMLQTAIRLGPQLGPAYLSLGGDVRRDSGGGAVSALPLLRIAVSLLPLYPPAAYAFGEALLSSRMPHDALPFLESAVSLVPAYSPYEYARGKALLACFRLGEASVYLQRAVQLSPGQGVQSARNDARRTPKEQEVEAMESALLWASVAHGDAQAGDISHGDAQAGAERVVFHADGVPSEESRALAYSWIENGAVDTLICEAWGASISAPAFWPVRRCQCGWRWCHGISPGNGRSR